MLVSVTGSAHNQYNQHQYGQKILISIMISLPCSYVHIPTQRAVLAPKGPVIHILHQPALLSTSELKFLNFSEGNRAFIIVYHH